MVKNSAETIYLIGVAIDTFAMVRELLTGQAGQTTALCREKPAFNLRNPRLTGRCVIFIISDQY